MAKTGHNATLNGGGFHHLALRVYDFDATLKFYIEGLGFQPTHRWGEDGRSKGEKDSRAVMLDTGDGNYLEVFAGGTRPHGTHAPEEVLLHFALRTTNVEDAVARAVAHGATVTVPTKDVIPDHSERPLNFHIAFVRGLDGESIEFFDNDIL